MAQYTIDDLLYKFTGNVETLYEAGDISKKLYDEFIEKNQKLFDRKVKEQLKIKKDKFLEQLKKSSDQDQFLKSEREYYYSWIYAESEGLKLPKRLNSAIVASDIREEIKRYIGGIDPDYHKSISLIQRQIDAKVFLDYYHWLENIFKYTYEDWLEDNIPSEVGIPINEIYNGLWNRVLEFQLRKSDYDRINETKQDCFEKAIEMNHYYQKKRFIKRYEKSDDKPFTLKKEIEKVESFIDKYQIEYGRAIEGIKDWHLIDGPTYKKFINQYNQYINLKGSKTHYYEVANGLGNLNLLTHLRIKYRKFLKGFEKENETQFIADNSIEENLSDNPLPDHLDDENDYEIIKQWILPDYVKSIKEIEKELYKRGYIDDKYKWVKHKTKLVEFVEVISHFRFFKRNRGGKIIQDFHKRQFFSERYGHGKTGLTETYKKTKPSIKIAITTFSWINDPEKSPIR